VLGVEGAYSIFVLCHQTHAWVRTCRWRESRKSEHVVWLFDADSGSLRWRLGEASAGLLCIHSAPHTPSLLFVSNQTVSLAACSVTVPRHVFVCNRAVDLPMGSSSGPTVRRCLETVSASRWRTTSTTGCACSRCVLLPCRWVYRVW
jgi:hypothetical protein